MRELPVRIADAPHLSQSRIAVLLADVMIGDGVGSWPSPAQIPVAMLFGNRGRLADVSVLLADAGLRRRYPRAVAVGRGVLSEPDVGQDAARLSPTPPVFRVIVSSVM